jgi:hypothetical protein
VPAVVARGAVRDILLGVAPADFDLAVGIGTLDILELLPRFRQSWNAYRTVACTDSHGQHRKKLCALVVSAVWWVQDPSTGGACRSGWRCSARHPHGRCSG